MAGNADSRTPGEGAPEDLTPEKMFQGEIQAYLDEHVYQGFQVPFRLTGIIDDLNVKAVRPSATAKLIVVEGMQDEDIPDFDRDWLRGLMDLGAKWETELRIPPRYFEK